MRKIWAMIGTLLIFSGLKSQEPVKAKKETTPVKPAKSEKILKGEVIPKVETAANNQSGLYVKVDSVNRKEALKGHVYLKVEGTAYSGPSQPFVYLKVEAATLPGDIKVTRYIKGESANKAHVYLHYDGVKGEAAPKGIPIYLKAEGNVKEGERGFVYLKVEAPSTTTAAADYYIKLPGVKGESK